MATTLGSRIFSGIQPTGLPHLGNYFGAISKWIQIANERKVITGKAGNESEISCQEPVYCIVDVHAYSSTNSSLVGKQLYENILSTTASLIALGLDPAKCILYKQSDVMEHFYLDNVLDNFVGPGRLTRMTQYKDKSTSSQFVTNSLLNYPMLQAADILLYRTNLVPVGEDQTQHIELTRDIATKFNSSTKSDLFPLPQTLLDKSEVARRIKSLRNPDKKMSKSDLDKKSFIEVIEEPDSIVQKCKKAMTDNINEVYYDPENRPGISNLMLLYHLCTDESMDQIRDKFIGIESAKFKLALAEVLIHKFAQTREEYKQLMANKHFLGGILKGGAEKARLIAGETIHKVKVLMGSSIEP